MRDGLLIVGFGGFGREAAAAALDGGFAGRVLGFLDDDPACAGLSYAGVAVLGPLGLLSGYPEASVVVATGRPDNYTSRPRIVDALGLPPHRYATVVHPHASLGKGTRVGEGSVVLAGTVATAGVSIGKHVAVMPSTVLTHDTEVGDFATLTSAVSLAGGTQVGTGTYIGAGTTVRQGVRIGDWSMIGMGSLVLTDIPQERLWYGRPARDQGPAPAAGFRGAANHPL